MIITKIDKQGLTLQGGTWIRFDNPSIPSVLYSEDEIDKEVNKRLNKLKMIELSQYLELKNTLKTINNLSR